MGYESRDKDNWKLSDIFEDYDNSDRCRTCDGTGTSRRYGSSMDRDDFEDVTCPVCGGSGVKKDLDIDYDDYSGYSE